MTLHTNIILFSLTLYSFINIISSYVDAFSLTPTKPRCFHHRIGINRGSLSGKQPFWSLYSINSQANNEDDEEELEPGQMRVSEIKAELTMRKVEYSDCYDKESLVERLRESRASGRADPSIIDEFNKKKLDANIKGESFLTPDSVSDNVVNAAVGGDGTLPGGMPPDMLKALMSNPELMTMLQNPKMQDVMKLMMSEGQDAVQKRLSDDPEMREMVMKLNFVMENALKQ